MGNKIDINETTNLYDNYLNYIYPVEVDNIINNDTIKYVLFNPSIHYWITLNEIGIQVVNLVQRYNNIGKVKNFLINKYNIDNDIFYEDVLPVINELLEHNFFKTIKNKEDSIEWMNQKINLNDIRKYPFNDIYISLSDNCNLNCIYCFNKENRKQRLKSNIRLDFNKIVDVMKEFKSINGTGVVFTGGEPTLNNNLLNLCKKAKEIQLNSHFITNGTLLGKVNIEELFENVDSFGISLDSVIQDEIDILWGNNNLLVKDMLNDLKKINEYSKHKKKMNITIMPIISKVNNKSLTKLIQALEEVLSDCNISWKMTQYSPIGNKIVDDKLGITQEQYFDYVSKSFRQLYIRKTSFQSKELEDINKQKHQINAFAYSESGKLLPPRFPKLLTCAPSFFIANNGDVFPCQGFEMEEFRLGNVYKSSLVDLFSREQFEEVKKRIIVNNKEQCGSCELKFVCTNKCGGCITSSNESKDKCKKITVKRLFLQTQIL